MLGYPDNPDWQNYWPADVQVIGKDILRFHAAIWPAMLMALELPLPKKLLVHGHINIGGAKISKTVGNVVDPMEIINDYGVDAFRYYFSRHIPTLDDGDFTWDRFENAYNNELANELGNLVSRVANMTKRYVGGMIGDEVRTEHDIKLYHDAMAAGEFNRAIDEVWLMVRSLNQFIEEVKPWEVAKQTDDGDSEAHLADIMAQCVSTLQQIAELLTPFLPTTASAIATLFAGGMVDELPGGILFPKHYIHTPNPRSADAK